MNIVCEVVCVEQGYLVTKRVSVQVGKRVEFIVFFVCSPGITYQRHDVFNKKSVFHSRKGNCKITQQFGPWARHRFGFQKQ